MLQFLFRFSWYLWIFVIVFLLLNVNGKVNPKQSHFWSQYLVTTSGWNITIASIPTASATVMHPLCCFFFFVHVDIIWDFQPENLVVFYCKICEGKTRIHFTHLKDHGKIVEKGKECTDVLRRAAWLDEDKPYGNQRENIG